MTCLIKVQVDFSLCKLVRDVVSFLTPRWRLSSFSTKTVCIAFSIKFLENNNQFRVLESNGREFNEKKIDQALWIYTLCFYSTFIYIFGMQTININSYKVSTSYPSTQQYNIKINYFKQNE